MSLTKLPLNPRKKMRCRRNAFTLSEMAVVLAIVGFLLAMIWVAVTSVQMSRSVSAANGELQAIVGNIRIAYAEQGSITNGGDVTPATLTRVLDRLKIFPLEMRGNAQGQIWHPWGRTAGPDGLGNVEITASQCSIAAGGGPANATSAETCFGVFFYNLPRDVCIRFLSGLTTTGTSLQQIFVNGPATNVVFPVTPAAATAACNAAGATNIIELVYLIKETAS